MTHDIRGKLLTATALLALTVCVRAEGETDTTPEPIKPFKPLVEKCQQWQSRDRNLGWKTLHEVDFVKSAGQWKPYGKWAQVAEQEGGSALIVTAPPGSTIFIPIGPQVKGEFAIEMVGRSSGEKIVPLGIMIDRPRAQGPAFLFSTRQSDRRHQLWTDTSDTANSEGTFGPVNLGTEPKMVLKQTYRVRLEVTRNEVAGYVDGKLIGRRPLSNTYDWTKLRQPHAMTVVDKITLSSFRIDQRAPTDDKNQEALDTKNWATIFGEGVTPQQIEAEAAKLVQLLDDDSWKVRETASQMIRHIGEFAVPALRDGLESGSAEMQWRAKTLLRSIAPSPTDTAQTSAQSDEPPVLQINGPVHLINGPALVPIRAIQIRR